MGEKLSQEKRENGMQASKETEEKRRSMDQNNRGSVMLAKEDRRNDTIMHQLTVKCITALL